MAFEPFTSCTGVAAPMPGANIDTDVIMPKQFLKGIDRAGLDAGVFHGLRFGADGAPNPDFILNQPSWRMARFLVVGPNFGCGSSREHAVWGLRQLGIRALVGTSFAGIFFDNCARNGLLAIEAAPDQVSALMTLVSRPDSNQLTIDLISQRISGEDFACAFDIDAPRKHALVRGLDPIGVTLQSREAIAEFEAAHFARNPWLQP
ncbi:MAG: 3-isopropylmalate dehydratase small subunit [Hyphomonadaceae bacterium]